MKKLLILIGLSVLLFVSCVSTIIKFDDSMAEEKTTRINTEEIGDVTEYNGIAVDWKRTYKVNIWYQIPAGDTTLLFDIDSAGYDSYVSFKGKNVMFRYNFQPQKFYLLVAAQKEGIYGLKIYAWDYKDKTPGSGTPREFEEHFVGFVPFLNTNNKNNDKKILN